MDNKISKKQIKEYTAESYQTQDPIISNKEKLTTEFSKMKDYAKSYRTKFEKDWRQIDAYLWNDPSKISNPKLKKSLVGSTMNHLFTVFNFRYSNIITNNVSEGISVIPGFVNREILDITTDIEDLDKKEEQNAELVRYILKVNQFRDILKFYWEELNIDQINKYVFWDYLIYGTGIVELYWNEANKNKNNDGNLDLYYIPLFSFFLEPGVIEWQDSRYLIVAQEINLLNLQRVHNLSNEEIKTITNNIGNTNNNISKNIIDNYDLSEYNKTVPYYRYYKKYLDENNNIKISLNYFVGDSNPYLVQTISDIGIDQFPFEVVFSYKKPTESYGQSLFKFLLPAQKMIIQQDALIQLRSIQAANPILLLSKDAAINAEKITKEGGMSPGQTYIVNGKANEALSVATLNEIPQDALAFIQVLKTYMDIMANTTESTTGQRAITGAGSGAVQQNFQNAQMPFKIQESEIQTYYQRLLNLVVKFLQAKQTEIRQLLLKNKTSSEIQYQAISYNIDEFEKLSKNCSISIKASSLIDMEKERQLILELYKWTLQFPELRGAISAIDIIRAFHLPNEDEMIANLQLQTDADYEQIATQIVQFIHQNVEVALQNQQQQAMLQAYVQSGQVNQADAEKLMQNMQQEIPIEQEISIVNGLIRNNPAKILENEKGVSQSGVDTMSELGG